MSLVWLCLPRRARNIRPRFPQICLELSRDTLLKPEFDVYAKGIQAQCSRHIAHTTKHTNAAAMSRSSELPRETHQNVRVSCPTAGSKEPSGLFSVTVTEYVTEPPVGSADPLATVTPQVIVEAKSTLPLI
ncbi:hypothetical protein ACFPRL_23370 [Pseudoclavibacter helvolus]